MAEERLSMNEVAEIVGVHGTTVARWVTVGVRGHKLASVLVGGRRFVLRTALEGFLAHGNDAGPPKRTATAHDASEILDAIWSSVSPRIRRKLVSEANPSRKDRQSNEPTASTWKDQ